MHLRAVRDVLVCAALVVGAAGCGSSGSSDDDRPASTPAPADTRTSSAPPRVGTPIPVGAGPAAVAVGDGVVWVANNTDGTVTRIDPGRERPLGEPVKVAPGPRALAALGSAAWVAGGGGTVERLDASSDEPTARARVADPVDLVIAGDTVWVASGTARSVARLDATTGEPAGDPVQLDGAPAALAAAGGTLWIAHGDDGTITPVDADDGRAGDPIDTGDGAVLALAATGDALWAAVAADPAARSARVLRLDRETGEPTADPVSLPGGVPILLAAGDAGVWMTNAGLLDVSGRRRGSRLRHLRPDGGGLLGTPIDAAERPAGLAVGSGAAWVADQATDTVVAVRPG